MHPKVMDHPTKVYLEGSKTYCNTKFYWRCKCCGRNAKKAKKIRHAKDCNLTVIVHVAGQRNDPKTCPESDEGKCTNPACGGEMLESGYGYAGGYGLGGYSYCQKCSTVYDFFEDKS